jgi:murein L,D-transpeptidase YcbB/YkuD
MKHIYLILICSIVLVSCSKNKKEADSNASIFGGISLFESNEITIDTSLIASYKDIDLSGIYKEFGSETIWNEDNLRKSALDILLNTEKDGLLSKNYSASILEDLNKSYPSLSDSTKINFDLLLTLNLKTFFRHLYSGRFKPKDIYNDWDLPENNFDVVLVLKDAILAKNLKEAYTFCEPKNKTYQQLKLALIEIKKLPKDTIAKIQLKEKLVALKQNKEVITIKQRLQYWNDAKFDTLTAFFDKQMLVGLKKFQKRHGLLADGIVGNSTLKALNYSQQQREEQITANLERWRWFKRDFGDNYLLLNIPDYKLFAIKDKDTAQIQRIVVGKSTRKTPILESKISNIVLNPNWTVPPTILKEDVFPLAIKDKGTFAKKGLNVVNNKGETVNPYSWKIEDAWKYKYVQNPSRNNSLGLMKINFPNKHSVYLHDTNHRDYFDIHKRSLSSGCVRLEKPLTMAAYLLNDSIKWNIQKIRDTTDIRHYNKIRNEKQLKIEEKNRKLIAKNPDLIMEEKILPKSKLLTTSIPIQTKINIYQYYWTAWSKDNTLHFREDIYSLDHLLFERLDN